MSINTTENARLISEFETKVETNPNKDVLISILDSRLNGKIDITTTITEDFMSFNLEYDLTEEQISVLDIFGEVYYSKPLIGDNCIHMIAPIIVEIEKNYTTFKNFISIPPTNFKHCIVSINSYSANQYKLNKILEFCLISYKITVLEAEIIKTYNHILPTNFKLKDVLDCDKKIAMNDPISFGELFNEIEAYIGTVYRNNLSEPLIEQLLNKRTILNRLFWLVYANEIKFVDNVQRKYLIDCDMIEEYQEKMSTCSNFNVENSVMMEDGSVQVTNINLLENWCEQLTKIENSVDELLDKIVNTYDNTIDNKIINDRLQEELTKYLKFVIKDDEEREIYNSLFQVNIGFALLNRSMSVLTDGLQNHITLKK